MRIYFTVLIAERLRVENTMNVGAVKRWKK